MGISVTAWIEWRLVLIGIKSRVFHEWIKPRVASRRRSVPVEQQRQWWFHTRSSSPIFRSLFKLSSSCLAWFVRFRRGSSPGLRAAARPRSATFIHFCVDLPWPRIVARRNRRAAFGSSVFTVPRVRAHGCRLCTRLHSPRPSQLTSSDSYTFIRAHFLAPSATPCHASRPLINFITRPNPRGKGLSTRETRETRVATRFTPTDIPPSCLRFRIYRVS